MEAGRAEGCVETLLHSGEFSHAVTDLVVKGRGIDFAFTRTYRNQTVGSGPLGPGWDFGYNQRLRELPNGDVEYFDGRGRRELFTNTPDGLAPPPGRFVELSRTSAGWVLIDARFNRTRFDRFGRLISLANAVKDSVATGLEITFTYDASSRLSRAEVSGRAVTFEYDGDGLLRALRDHTGRTLSYGYDQGRLSTVTSPTVSQGLVSGATTGLTTSYTYSPGVGDLAATLNTRDNLATVTDRSGQEWLSLTFTDADGDSRPDEVTTQTWGGHDLTIGYSFAASGADTTVTDRRGQTWSYHTNGKGHLGQVVDPLSAVTTIAVNEHGLELSRVLPSGRSIVSQPPTEEVAARSLGNYRFTKVVAGFSAYGSNGSDDELETEYSEYHVRTNQPILVRDPRGMVTFAKRFETGLPELVVQDWGGENPVQTRFTYNDYGQPATVINGNGHVTKTTYVEEGPKVGFPKSVTVDDGGLSLTTTFETDERGKVTKVTDPRGVTHEYVYNELDWLVEERVATSGAGEEAPALNYVNSYLYDANGNLAEERRAHGDGTSSTRTQYDYGVLNEVTEIRREVTPGVGDWVTESFAHDENFNVTVHVAPDQQRTVMTYDSRNLMVSRTFAEGSADEATEHFSYTVEGQLETQTDPRGKAWTTRYDGHGRVAASIDPLGNAAKIMYEDNGGKVVTRSFDSDDVLLAKSETIHDLLGRPIEQRDHLWQYTPVPEGEEPAPEPPEGSEVAVTVTSYDGLGNVASVVDPLGRTTSYTYDGAERLKEVIDAVGNRSFFARDAGGNIVLQSDYDVMPDGGTEQVTTSFGYDALGRPVRSTDLLGNTTLSEYDARGNVVRIVEPGGFETTSSYDGLDRLTETVRPEGIAVSYGYDAASRLVSYQDALGNATSYEYDDLGRQMTVTYPDQSSESYEYDAASNLERIVDAKGTEIVNAYDDANRLTTRAITPAPGVEGPTAESYQYDGLSRTTRAVSGSVVTELAYDSLSRLLSDTTGGRAVAFLYNAAGDRTSVVYPSGILFDHVPDALGRPTEINRGGVELPLTRAVTYGYRGTGLVASKALGVDAQQSPVLTGSTTYDGARRPVATSFVRDDDKRVFAENLAWSPRSLKSGVSRPELNGLALGFSYDDAGRLAEAERLAKLDATSPRRSPAGLPEHYGFVYDAAENLLAKSSEKACDTEGVELPLDGSGRNRPGSVNGQALVWDANGNLEEKGDLTFHYDWRDRLTRVTDATDNEIARYAYDALDRRVERVIDGVSYETVWSDWQPIEEYADGVLVSRRGYGLGLDEIVQLELDVDGDGSLAANELYLPLYDGSGNVVAVVHEATENLVERYEYSPYGERYVLVNDLMPPVVEQVRVRNGEIWVELSEEVLLDELEAAVDAGNLTLTNLTEGLAIDFALSQPVMSGPEAGRRLVVAPTGELGEAGWPDTGEQVELVIPASALVDTFGDEAEAGVSGAIVWAGDQVVADTAAPRVDQICLTAAGLVEIVFSEEPDLSSLAAIEINGSAVAWELGADAYTLRTTAAFEPGAYSVVIGPGVEDLAENGLVEGVSESFTVVEGGAGELVFAASMGSYSPVSSIGNPFGFDGLMHEPEAGFVFARRRYLDVEMGRFTTTDPYGYADGPSSYQFALNNPANYGDPMGEVALVDNLVGGAVGVGVGWAANCILGDCDYSVQDAAIDFGLGFATSGLSSVGSLRHLRHGASGVARFTARAGLEVGMDIGAEYVRTTIRGEEASWSQLALGGAVNFGIGELGAAGARAFRTEANRIAVERFAYRAYEKSIVAETRRMVGREGQSIWRRGFNTDLGRAAGYRAQKVVERWARQQPGRYNIENWGFGDVSPQVRLFPPENLGSLAPRTAKKFVIPDLYYRPLSLGIDFKLTNYPNAAQDFGYANYLPSSRIRKATFNPYAY